MDHRDWPGKQWRAERQTCHCTCLTARFSQTVKPFWRLSLSIFCFLNVSFPFQNNYVDKTESLSTCHILSKLLFCCQYAVKAQTSLAPLSRFRGSRITTAHAPECCRFQSYANTVASPMKLTKREPHSWDPRQRTTWSRLVTSDFNSVFCRQSASTTALMVVITLD